MMKNEKMLLNPEEKIRVRDCEYVCDGDMCELTEIVTKKYKKIFRCRFKTINKRYTCKDYKPCGVPICLKCGYGICDDDCSNSQIVCRVPTHYRKIEGKKRRTKVRGHFRKVKIEEKDYDKIKEDIDNLINNSKTPVTTDDIMKKLNIAPEIVLKVLSELKEEDKIKKDKY